jgi:hypothetical protein
VKFEITITETFEHNGHTYTEIRCTEGVDEPDIIRKIIPGVGSYGSERKPITTGPYPKELSWWAEYNPSGRPGKAVERIDGLYARTSALNWLLAPSRGGVQ